MERVGSLRIVLTGEGPKADTRHYTEELGPRLANGIKEVFSFPFLLDEHCKPDINTRYVPERHFHLNGHVLYAKNDNSSIYTGSSTINESAGMGIIGSLYCDMQPVGSLDTEAVTREYNQELGSRLADGIKQAFTFPFLLAGHCKPDGSTHYVPERNFHLNGHVFVLHDIRLFPGLTFRALEVNPGELNVYTQDVKFEVDMPTIGGYFYMFSDKKDVKPEYTTGTFKINYDTSVVKGITNFFLNGDRLGICNMAVDFELVGSPRVDLYYDEADGSVGQLDVNRAGCGEKVAEVLWPSVRALLYWLFRDKLWNTSSDIPWNDPMVFDQHLLHDEHRRSNAFDFLNDVLTKVKSKLAERMKGGRLPMPDIDLMVASMIDPDEWGNFKATSGSLGDVTSMYINRDTTVHARSENEIVIVGRINFSEWTYCYDEYTIKANTGDATGKIVSTLGDNEAFITITAIRNDEGVTVVKDGRFEYINATNKHNDITNLGEFGWLKANILDWMSGLMDAGKPDLNKVINDCLNEVLVEIDVFLFWDELNARALGDRRLENLLSPDASDGEE